MPRRSAALRLGNMVEAAERIATVVAPLTTETFEADWQARWLVQRGIEIISKASRDLPASLKERIARPSSSSH